MGQARAPKKKGRGCHITNHTFIAQGMMIPAAWAAWASCGLCVALTGPRRRVLNEVKSKTTHPSHFVPPA